jgi:hypothetical protein
MIAHTEYTQDLFEEIALGEASHGWAPRVTLTWSPGIDDRVSTKQQAKPRYCSPVYWAKQLLDQLLGFTTESFASKPLGIDQERLLIFRRAVQ